MSIDLDAIKQRVEAATEGPWAYGGSFVETVAAFDLHRFDILPETVARIDLLDEDGEFIAASRTDIPALIAEAERLRAIVERVESLRDEMGEGMAFTILTMGKEADYPISYFLEYLDTALDGTP